MKVFRGGRATGRRVGRAGLGLAAALVLAASPAAGQVEAQAWTLSTSLRLSFTDNVLLTPDGPSETITGAMASLGYSRLSSRASFAASGWTNAQAFDRLDAYDSVAFGAGAAGSRRFSRLVSGRLSAAFADGFNLQAFYSSSVALPQVDVRSGTAAAGLDFALAPDTSLRTSLEAYGVRYRTDAPVSSAQLPADALTPPEVLAPLRPRPEPELPLAPDASQHAIALLSIEALRATRLDYWTWHAGASLVHGFSPRTQASLDLGYRRTHQEPLLFEQGEQLEARAALRRALDQTANLSLAYAYQDNRFGPGYVTHTGTLGFEKRLRETVRLDLSLGASYLDGPSADVSAWQLVGGGGLTARLRRTQLAARYTRTRYQALVLGRNQVSDLAYASLARAFHRRVSFSAWGYYNRSRDPVERAFSYDSAAAGASLAVLFTKRASGGASYGFQHFQGTGFPDASRQLASLFLSYVWVGK